MHQIIRILEAQVIRLIKKRKYREAIERLKRIIEMVEG